MVFRVTLCILSAVITLIPVPARWQSTGWQCTLQPDGRFTVDYEPEISCNHQRDRLHETLDSRVLSLEAVSDDDCTDTDCSFEAPEPEPPAGASGLGFHHEFGLERARKTPREKVLELMKTKKYSSMPDRLEALTLALNEVGRREGWVWKQQNTPKPIRTAQMLLDGSKNFGCCTDFSGALVELATAAPPHGLGMPAGQEGVHKEKTRGKFGKGLITVAIDRAIDPHFHGNVITRKHVHRSALERGAATKEPSYTVSGLAQFSNHVYVVQPGSGKVYDPSVGRVFQSVNEMIAVNLKVSSTGVKKAAIGVDTQGKKVQSIPVVSRKKIEAPAGFEVDLAADRKRFALKRNVYYVWDLQSLHVRA